MKMTKRFLRILLSLVMVLGLMPGMSLTAYAETIPADKSAANSGMYFVNFKLDNQENGNDYHVYDGYGADKLFDRNGTSRLVVDTRDNNKPFTAEKPYWAEFHYGSLIVPKKLYLCTGDDPVHYPNRNPVDWVLKAKANKGDAWTTISTVTKAEMGSTAYTAHGYDVNATQGYMYFRIEFGKVGNPEGTDDSKYNRGYCIDLSELYMSGKEASTVTYKVVNGTWSDGTKEDKKETVADGSKPASVPTGMKASEGYTGGAWDTNPATATITQAKTFTYKFTVIPTYEVTYKVVGGTWSDGTKEDKKETVQSGAKPASVPTGMKASQGYTGGSWDTDPTKTTVTGATTFTYIFNPYSCISGEGSTWTKSTGLPLTFQFKNSRDDSETYDNFKGAQVDGKQLTRDKEYTASRGSVFIELQSTYLETLSVGEHTLTAEFTDGKADAKFTVVKGTPINLPQTGDSSNVFIHVLVGLLAIAGLSLVIKKRK